MHEGAFDSDVREAVGDLHSYLSDQVPPLLVADAVDLLVAQPPELGADALRSWVSGQLRVGAASTSPGVFLYHAIKKVHHLGDLKLVDVTSLRPWLEAMIDVLAAQAPLAEQDALRGQLRQATAIETSLAPAVTILQRQGMATPPSEPGPTSAGADASVNAEMARNVRQFALLLARLAPADGVAAQGVERADLAPQLLITAAQTARSQQEFEQYLGSISNAGLMKEVRLSDLFNTMSRGLPNWFLAGAGQGPSYQSASTQAMHRIVSFVADPAKTAAHFRELYKTAAKQFNEGALGRAVQVLEVAERLLLEKRIDKTSADLILGSAHEDLDAGKLMTQTQEAAQRPVFRRLLNSYPTLTPHGLLLSLDNEPERSKRRLWIALLEVHGPAGRQAALERLVQSFADTNPAGNAWMLQRNFVYLLHRIPAAEGTDLGVEVALSTRCSEISNPVPLVREALLNLGLRRREAAEAALRQRLRDLEAALESPGKGPHEATELWRMLGLVTAGLVRQGSASARRLVVEHGLKQRPQLGDTLARLVELGSGDLSADPATVERLLAGLRALLPVRVLGVRVRGGEDAQPLIKALSGTPSPAVRAAFEDLTKRYADSALAELARAALTAWASGATAPATAGVPTIVAPEADEPPPIAATPSIGLSGDLEIFGLPELMQTLGQMQATGRLALRDRQGAPRGEFLLRDGQVVSGRVGALRLPDAFYQILEVPGAGTFEFSRQPPEAVGNERAVDAMPLLMEGMRRYDELQRARALVPDHAFVQATGARPTPFPEEADGSFIRDVWMRVKDGTTPLAIESVVAADAYRVRVLLGHWLTQNAIEIRQLLAAPPP
jgi:Domain of unknown function (DUF4388)